MLAYIHSFVPIVNAAKPTSCLVALKQALHSECQFELAFPSKARTATQAGAALVTIGSPIGRHSAVRNVWQ